MCDSGYRGTERRSWRARCLVLACLVLPATWWLAGCGKPSYQLDTAPVRGTVTLDGQPLPSGYVVVPTAHGRMAKGRIEPDGTFELSTYSNGDGVQVGTHPLIVVPVPPDEPAEKRVPIPDRYLRAGTSGLTIEVKPGEDHEIELQLTTKEQKI